MKFHLKESNIKDFHQKLEELAKIDWNRKHYLYHVHFTDVLKLGTNLIHRKIFGPIGIYAFPIKFYIDDIIKDDLSVQPFSHRKYAYILELDTNSRYIYFKDPISYEYVEKVKEIAKSWKFDEKTLEEFDTARRFADIYSILNKWFEANYLSYDKSVNLWKFLNRDLGLDVILDDGTYTISYDIEAQTVFMPPFFGYKVVDVYQLDRTTNSPTKEQETYYELMDFSGNINRVLKFLENLAKEHDIKFSYKDYQFIKNIFSLYKKILVGVINSGVIKNFFDSTNLRDAMIKTIIYTLSKKYPVIKNYYHIDINDIKKNFDKIKDPLVSKIARKFFEKIIRIYQKY